MKLSICRKFPALMLTFIPFVIAFFSLSAIAESQTLGEEITIDGTMRWRVELDGKDFSNGTAMNELSYLRTRLGLGITSIENVQVYIQMQDSRNLGTNSSSLTNDTNLGLHQGYIKLSEFPVKNLALQVGRYEAPYGRHRLMGTVGWHNVGRSFDGIRGSYMNKAFGLDLFCLKIDERSFDFPPNNKDWKLYGLYGTFMDKSLDLFFLYDLDLEKTGDNYDLARFTIGGYFNNALESGLKFELDAAYQGGKQSARDIEGFMVAGDVSYKVNSLVNKVGLGFDITSGDDNLSDTKIKSFNNLYYTGHKFRGFMDQFLATSQQGLMDIIFRGSMKPSPKSAVLVDIHHFQTMEDYLAPAGGTSKAIGQEIDITGKYNWRKGLDLQGGASVFIASEEWRPDADTALWIYAMITAGF